MTTQEMVINVLKAHPCLSGTEITGFVYRMYGVNISSQSATTALRPLIAEGEVGKDNHGGKMVYWLRETSRPLVEVKPRVRPKITYRPLKKVAPKI